MIISVVRFNNSNQPDFFKTLNKRINQYFKDHNKTRYENTNMKLKSAFMLALYFTPFILMLTGGVSSFGWMMVMWAIMGFGTAGIGLSIMHDANHGSYSQKAGVNRMKILKKVSCVFHQHKHEIFPNICHVHYKDIAPIVEETAKEFGVPYHHHRTFMHALKSHFTLLHELGTGRYDQKLEAQIKMAAAN